MTLPEVLIWPRLRAQPMGVKFRRQHPSGTLGIDFFCSDARLAVEIDGKAHDMGDRPQRDARRDAWLASEGIETLRVPATDILRDPDAAAAAVVAYAVGRLPLHHPARAGRSPSPRQARGGTMEPS